MASYQKRAIEAASAALGSREAGAMPEGLPEQIQAGIRMVAESEDESRSLTERKELLGQAIKQFQPSGPVFLPTDVSRSLESARVLADRARHEL